MGLDVTAYKGLKKIECHFDADGEPIDPASGEYIEDQFQPYINPDFPGRADGVEHKAVYSYADSLDGWSGGYTRYNWWREELAKLAGYPAIAADRSGFGDLTLRHDQSAFEATEGPFWELICFSDCEGVIGSVISKKLAADFADHEEKAAAIGDYFYEKYIQWKAVFEFAAQDGAVDFH